MAERERHFRLSDLSDAGVRCDASGLFVGETPLLERASWAGGEAGWRPRPPAEINRDLGKLYGNPTEFGPNIAGLESVARALNRNDVVHAQIVALLLGIPDPPAPERSGSGELETGDEAGARPDLEHAGGASKEQLGKFNPYHDERGRFTTSDGAVGPGGAESDAPEAGRVASDHRQQTRPDERTRGASTTGRSEDEAPAITQASVEVRSCGDAFRACVQIAAFQRPSMISNCIAALRTCRSTGLPTIFAPGVVGQQ